MASFKALLAVSLSEMFSEPKCLVQKLGPPDVLATDQSIIPETVSTSLRLKATSG
jgi:hypothetical protein